MRSYVGFRITQALVVLGLFATIVLHGGWQSAAAAFAIAMGLAFLGCAIAIGVMADRDASPAPPRRAPPRARTARPIPADARERARPAERRREDAPPTTRPRIPPSRRGELARGAHPVPSHARLIVGR